MPRSRPRFSIYCDCRRQLMDGTCPLRLRLTYFRVSRYIGLDLIHWLDRRIPTSLPPNHWDRVNSKRPKGKYAAIKLALDQLVAYADDVLNGLNPPISRLEFSDYDWKRFWNVFLQVPGEDADVFFWFARTASQCRDENRHNTAASYETAMKAIQEFSGDKLPLESITPAWLRDLELFWKGKGRKAGGISVHMRALRAIINVAIKAGALPKDKYPFGKYGFSIKSGRQGQEKVLRWEELSRLWFYSPPEFSMEDKALDFWKLSYMWQGANPADIFRFKNGDVQHGRITFDRKKTENTKRGGERVTVFVEAEAESIIRKWMVDESPEGYLLPVLSPGMNESEIVKAVRNSRRILNRALKKIAAELELPDGFSMAWARPTFATHMEKHGANIREIQSALGHSNRSTTEIYLARENDIRESVQRAIPKLDFRE
ncbi:MAG: phage integrase SAM-like domain-containing protein [Lewinellaceae bacterium]|nr:phage integrase SAM-like domain-containing protein [Lewinellaceae bacterium]